MERLRKVCGPCGQTHEGLVARARWNAMVDCVNMLLDKADEYRRGDSGEIDVASAERCEQLAKDIVQEVQE